MHEQMNRLVVVLSPVDITEKTSVSGGNDRVKEVLLIE